MPRWLVVLNVLYVVYFAIANYSKFRVATGIASYETSESCGEDQP
jgi:hypothetical protein